MPEKEFKREPRYVVFKIKDVLEHLSACEIDRLQEFGEKCAAGRASKGKPPLNAVVVEQDWPEFDLVWQMIEARMTGQQYALLLPPIADRFAEAEAFGRMEGVRSVQEQTAVIVRAALELLEAVEGCEAFPPEKMAAFRRVFCA